MTEMLDTITAKSDQMNADDMIGGKTVTIRITKVDIKMDEQPVSIHFDGDQGKPYRPGKSMRRVLVNVWGADAKLYIGRSMTLYRDAAVVFGGVAVGGIRISHMSHIDKPITMALTATRANKKPFTVKPLVVAKEAQAATVPAQHAPSPSEPEIEKQGHQEAPPEPDFGAEWFVIGADGKSYDRKTRAAWIKTMADMIGKLSDADALRSARNRHNKIFTALRSAGEDDAVEGVELEFHQKTDAMDGPL